VDSHEGCSRIASPVALCTTNDELLCRKVSYLISMLGHAVLIFLIAQHTIFFLTEGSPSKSKILAKCAKSR
jgi:hypothetical protein